MMEGNSPGPSDDQPSNPDFEALINLLATDDDGQVNDDVQKKSADLRRPNGQFDYRKVREFFETSNKPSSPTGRHDSRPQGSHGTQLDLQVPSTTDDQPAVGIFTRERNEQDNRQHQPSRNTDQPRPPAFPNSSGHPSPQTIEELIQQPHMISISPLVLPASRALPNIDRQSQGTDSSSPHSNISRSHSEQQRLSSQGVNPLTFVPMGPDSRSSSPKSHGPTDNSRSPMHEMPSYLPPRPPSRLGTFPFDRSPSFQHSQHPQHHQSPNREDTETQQDYYDVEGGETRHGESDLLRALRETLLESRRQTDALNEALILARRETAELQQRCEELKALAEELRIPQDLTNQSVTNSQIATSSNPAPNPHAQSQIQRNPNADPAFDQSRATHSPSSSTERGAESPPMDVMELMDEYELRENFRALLTALSLPFNVPELHQTVSLMSSLPQLPSKTRASPKSVSDIIRALEFVRFVDELVWKRSNPQYAHRAPSDNLGIFSEANIRGLEDRVELWERAVRSPKKKK